MPVMLVVFSMSGLVLIAFYGCLDLQGLRVSFRLSATAAGDPRQDLPAPPARMAHPGQALGECSTL